MKPRTAPNLRKRDLNLDELTDFYLSTPRHNRAGITEGAEATETDAILPPVSLDPNEAILHALKIGKDRFKEFILILLDNSPLYREELALYRAESNEGKRLLDFKLDEQLFSVKHTALREVHHQLFSGRNIHSVYQLSNDLLAYAGEYLFVREDLSLHYIDARGQAVPQHYDTSAVSALGLPPAFSGPEQRLSKEATEALREKLAAPYTAWLEGHVTPYHEAIIQKMRELQTTERELTNSLDSQFREVHHHYLSMLDLSKLLNTAPDHDFFHQPDYQETLMTVRLHQLRPSILREFNLVMTQLFQDPHVQLDQTAYRQEFEKIITYYLPHDKTTWTTSYFATMHKESTTLWISSMKDTIERTQEAKNRVHDLHRATAEEQQASIDRIQHDRGKAAVRLLDSTSNGAKGFKLPTKYRGLTKAQLLGMAGRVMPTEVTDEATGSSLALVAILHQNKEIYAYLNKHYELNLVQKNNKKITAKTYHISVEPSMLWQSDEKKEAIKQITAKDAVGELLRRTAVELRTYLEDWALIKLRIKRLKDSGQSAAAVNRETIENSRLDYVFAWLNTLTVEKETFETRKKEAEYFLRLVELAFEKPEESELYHNVLNALADPKIDWGFIANNTPFSNSSFRDILKQFVKIVDKTNHQGHFDVLKMGDGSAYWRREDTIRLLEENAALNSELYDFKQKLLLIEAQHTRERQQDKEQHEKKRREDTAQHEAKLKENDDKHQRERQQDKEQHEKERREDTAQHEAKLKENDDKHQRERQQDKEQREKERREDTARTDALLEKNNAEIQEMRALLSTLGVKASLSVVVENKGIEDNHTNRSPINPINNEWSFFQPGTEETQDPCTLVDDILNDVAAHKINSLESQRVQAHATEYK